MRDRARLGVDQQRRAARLQQQLAAATARRERLARSRRRRTRPRPAGRRPIACSADTSPHSAHSVRPYDAFSTLQPVTMRPSSTSAAAPTCRCEYGAYALLRDVAAPRARSASQSIVAHRDRSYGWPTAAGGIARPTAPATTMIVTT